jgi:cell division protein FtsI (penicillin-binding protein 3)
MIMVGMLVMLLVLGCRAFQIQVLSAPHLSHLAATQLRQTITVPALRGGIYDRNGAVLALSVPTKMVIADNFQITNPASEAAALSPLVGLPIATLEPMLRRHSGYVVLRSHLPTGAAAKIARNHFPGITMVDTSQRAVPNGSLANSVIGLVNAQGLGAAGLEYQYQKQLAGSTGIETLLETPYGVQLPQGGIVHQRTAVPGTGLELTLDEPLQYVTEQALGAQMLAKNAVSGEAIVMDTRTGQILAMANLVNTKAAKSAGAVPVPIIGNQDPSLKGIAQAQNNLSVTQTYLPGSVFKLVTFSAALQAGLVSPNQVFSIPDYVSIDHHTFHDAEQHPLLHLTATQILAQSSNIGTYEIANSVGESRLLAQVQQLGFGQSTALHFPGESGGLLMNAARWSPTDIIDLPIGQVDATTVLQVLDAYNAVANNGVFVQPSLVRATVGSDGTIAKIKSVLSHRVLTPGVAQTVTKMLEEVVASGTGTPAAIPGYLIAGKTGTSGIPTPGKNSYIPGAYNASFVGFAPANHPVISAIIVLQRPTPDIFGSTNAAPVFSKIMKYALHRYGIPTSPGGSGTQAKAALINARQDLT